MNGAINGQRVGILHPGEMGISIAALMRSGGHSVYWVEAGRSAQSQARAQEHGLLDAGSLAHLCESCTAIVSVCPPHAAEEVATQVAACNFAGIYVDANAIAPERARRIAQIVTEAGARFVDGGIIGPPAWKPATTRLYLSGPDAAAAAGLFGEPLEVCLLGDAPDAASALKMCYAAYTKGTTALLCAILASAEMLGVRQDLEQQWAHDHSPLAENATRQVRNVTAKAWRFVGEMEEIAATFESAGLPGGFHLAAADLYRRIASFKDAPTTPALEAVLEALTIPAEEHV